jgi:hypothetical protein
MNFPDTFRTHAAPVAHRLRQPLARLALIVATVACLAPTATPLRAQVASASTLRVFLDCPTGGCDRDFLVTDLPFALWTQDRRDADVHLLITRIGTAAGGSEFTLGFIGQGRFARRVDTLVTSVPPNTSDDARRRELSRVAKIGLLAFAARLPGQQRFSVTYAAPAATPAGSAPLGMDDPWNLWVYRVRANGSGNAESRSSNYDFGGSASASRVTDDWKVSLYAQNEYRASRYELSDSTERRYIQRSLDANVRVVRSLTDHWSVGGRAATAQSDYRNLDASASLDVSAEYNLFRWEEATSRQLIALVAVGGRYADYHEITIRGFTTEARPIARAVIAGESRQTWGSVDASLRYSRYLHDNDSYSASFNGRTTLRISRGLSLELRGEAAKVNDQLYLPRGDATDDEVLTRQRALATAFRLSGSVGLSFTFGSIFNTIVNPRLEELR